TFGHPRPPGAQLPQLPDVVAVCRSGLCLTLSTCGCGGSSVRSVMLSGCDAPPSECATTSMVRFCAWLPLAEMEVIGPPLWEAAPETTTRVIGRPLVGSRQA